MSALRGHGWLDSVFSWACTGFQMSHEDELLRSRVTLYLKVLVLLTWGLLIASSLPLIGQSPTSLGPELMWWRGGHLGAAALLTGLWLWARSHCCSPGRLRAYDALGTLVLTAGVSGLASSLPLSASPDLAALLAVVLVLTLRASLVPSPAWHTLKMGLLAVIPLTIIVQFRYRGEVFAGMPVNDLMLFRAPAWGVGAIAVSVVISRVVYGLQDRVRQALQVGQYKLEQKLGEGAMGVVYKATHVMLRRPTAVKLLSTERTGPNALARFEREVWQTSRLVHPNTVSILDYGRTPDGIFYYAMEYVPGVTLEQLVRHSGPLPAERVWFLLRQIAGSLSEAHGKGLVHRDIKPSNIMVANYGGQADHVKVLDFGLVKDLDSGDAALTQADAIVGTPLYIAPEAIVAPDRVDARSDVYALGTVAYFLLTGTPVFGGHNLVEVSAQHLHGTPEPPSTRLGKAIPEKLERLVLSCLAKSPEERPQDAMHLMALLRDSRPEREWTGELAVQWWEEHQPELLQEGGTTAPAPTDVAFTVDLNARRVPVAMRLPDNVVQPAAG